MGYPYFSPTLSLWQSDLKSSAALLTREAELAKAFASSRSPFDSCLPDRQHCRPGRELFDFSDPVATHDLTLRLVCRPVAGRWPSPKLLRNPPKDRRLYR